MKRELGIAVVDLPVVYVLRILLVMDVILVNVQTKSGARTGNVLYLKKEIIVMSAMKNVGRDY